MDGSMFAARLHPWELSCYDDAFACLRGKIDFRKSYVHTCTEQPRCSTMGLSLGTGWCKILPK